MFSRLAASRIAPDGYLLFGTRIARLFAYGFLSVVLVLYLAQVGLSDAEIGLLLTLTLTGTSISSASPILSTCTLVQRGDGDD